MRQRGSRPLAVLTYSSVRSTHPSGGGLAGRAFLNIQLGFLAGMLIGEFSYHFDNFAFLIGCQANKMAMSHMIVIGLRQESVLERPKKPVERPDSNRVGGYSDKTFPPPVPGPQD